MFSAEGGQFIGGHAMNPDNKLKTAAALSDLWDRGMVKRLRAGDGAMILPGRRVSLAPDGAAGRGRHLLGDPLCASRACSPGCWSRHPTALAGQRLWREPKPESGTALARYRDNCWASCAPGRRCAVDKKTGERKPNELAPAGAAAVRRGAALWIELADQCEAAMAPGGELEPVERIANKLPEQAARVAGVLALVDEHRRGRDRPGAPRPRDRDREAPRGGGRSARPRRRLHPDLGLGGACSTGCRRSWPQPLVSLPDIYQRGLNAISDKATAARIGILADHGWPTKLVAGAVVAGVKRQDVWAIHGKGAGTMSVLELRSEAAAKKGNSESPGAPKPPNPPKPDPPSAL